jgi:predicted esterase
MPNLSGKSVLIAGGRRDPIANPSETRRLVDLLAQADAAVEVYWHDGGHELGHDDLVAAKNWIKERTKGLDASQPSPDQ